jgi:transaldolase
MTTEQGYLNWLVENTATTWWHDSGDPEELRRALSCGASGVTTNPLLTHQALRSDPEGWAAALSALPGNLAKDEQAEALIRCVATNAAEMLRPVYEATEGAEGYVCAHVNPSRAGDREAMLAMARRFSAWAPNITIKLPATLAGLDVLEDCTAEGISSTLTVSFTVPQTIAIAERYRLGARRAEIAGKTPPRCFSVIMLGRLDDYLREVALDRKAVVSESDIRLAGLAVTKRAYRIYQERGYEPRLLVAALRGPYHMTGLAGADLTMSIHPKIQDVLANADLPRESGIEAEVDGEAIERLRTIPDFVRAFEPEGMPPQDFISYGLTQRTLSQFVECGWAMLAAMKLS